MSKRILSVFLALACVAGVLPAPSAYAQRNGSQNSTSGHAGPQKYLSTIVFSGVAGAVLGLSTLSFYGRPQEKLSHIAIGAAIGIIGGALFSTYKAATDTKDYYNLNDKMRDLGPKPEGWEVAERFSETGAALTPSAGLTFSF